MSIETAIVEAFGHVVQATEEEILSYLQGVDNTISGLHYEYGHPLTIINKLAQMETSQAQQREKYPLVALFMDFPEEQPRTVGALRKAKSQVIIATRTIKDRTVEQRYATAFNTILTPIYEELCRQLAKSAYFFHSAVPAHQKIDRPFWGKEGLYGNYTGVATDYLDCIEIRNVELVPGRKRACAASPAPFKNF
jgi:hypothetical protein